MINRRSLPLNALRAFDTVARHLSFTAGAQALRVSQSALSRHVISLEEILGVKLLERRAQGVVLTPAGAALHPVVQKAFDRLEIAINDIQTGERQSSRLRVHLPPTFLNKVAARWIRDFRAEHPLVTLDITSSHVTGLPEEEIDIAIVYDRPGADDSVTDLLWKTVVKPACSPAIAAAAKDRTLQEFLASSALLHVKLDGEPRGLLWSAFAQNYGLSLDTNAGLAFDTAMAAVQFAKLNGGIVLCDVAMFADELDAGELTAPFDANFEDGYGYYMKLHPDDLIKPAVAEFRSWILARFSAAPPVQRGKIDAGV